MRLKEEFKGNEPDSAVDKSAVASSIEKFKPVSKSILLKKRAFDTALVILTLPATLPIIAAIYIGLKISGQKSVFFKQKRKGLDDNLFSILKFRTMPEDHKHDPDLNGEQVNSRASNKFCEFLRKSRFDEWPQILNVLNGEMSLVGPRPHPPENDNKFAKLCPTFAGRTRVRPGMTGFQQAHDIAAYAKDDIRLIKKSIKRDNKYIDDLDKNGLLGDIKIIGKTAVNILVSLINYMVHLTQPANPANKERTTSVINSDTVENELEQSPTLANKIENTISEHIVVMDIVKGTTSTSPNIGLNK